MSTNNKLSTKQIYIDEFKSIPPALMMMMATGFATQLTMGLSFTHNNEKDWMAASGIFANMARTFVFMGIGALFTQVRFVGKHAEEAKKFADDRQEIQAQHEYKQVGEYYHSAHPLIAIYSLIVTPILLFGSKEMMLATGQTEMVANNVQAFFRTYALGIFAQLELTNMVQTLFPLGKLKVIMALCFTQLLIEMPLAYALTYGFAPLSIPALGLSGYGLAQTIQPYLCMFGMGYYIQRRHNNDPEFAKYHLNFTWKKLKTVSKAADLLIIGGWAGLQITADTVGSVISSIIVGWQASKIFALNIFSLSILWATIGVLQFPLACARTMEKMLAQKVGDLAELLANHADETAIKEAVQNIRRVVLHCTITFLGFISLPFILMQLMPKQFLNVFIAHIDPAQLPTAKLMFQYIISAHVFVDFIIFGAAGLRGAFAETWSPVIGCLTGSIGVNFIASYFISKSESAANSQALGFSLSATN